MYGWPDLAVLGIVLPSDPVIEMDTVKIDAVIANKGYANEDWHYLRHP